MFGGDAMMAGDSLVYNPQFEWGGGGFASTPSDLARWMAGLRLGRAFALADWPAVIAPPPGVADTARHWRGMGLHVDLGALGPTYGHSGYMPGYVSWMRWYERAGVGVAIMVNASDTLRLRDDGFAWADSVVVGMERGCGWGDAHR
jgi:D-alanyl-D-alanine carboxypeptidase